MSAALENASTGLSIEEAFLYKQMHWYKTCPDTGKRVEMPFTETTLTSQDTVKSKELPTAAAQENEKDSAWHQSRCGFTIRSMGVQPLSSVGSDLNPTEKHDEFDNALMLWPARIATCETAEDCIATPGRFYNGVCIDVKTGGMDVYRMFRPKGGQTTAVRLTPEAENREFAFALEEREARAIIAQKNLSDKMVFVAPFYVGGLTIEVQLPRVPVAMFERLTAQYGSSPAPKTPKKTKKQTKKTAPKPEEMPSILAKTPAAPSRAGTAALIEGGEPNKHAAGKRKRASEEAGSAKKAMRMLSANDPVTSLADLDAHYEALRAKGKIWANPLAGKTRYGTMLQDEAALYTINAYYQLKNAFDARPPVTGVPVTLPKVDAGDLLIE